MNLGSKFDKNLTVQIMLFVFVVYMLSGFKAHAAIRVSTDLDSATSLRQEIFGVHGEMLWSKLRLGKTDTSEVYSEIGLKFIRLPGGTTANLYLWQQPKFGCEGNIPENKLSRASNFNRALGRKNRTYTVDDFISFINSTETSFSYVVNVICDTPESTRKLAEAFKEAGIKIDRAEMGNELHYREYLDGKNPELDYIRLIEPHIAAIHTVFPEAKIGGIVSTASFRSLRFPNREAMIRNKHDRRDMAFDQTVAKHESIDALVPHLYSTFGLSPGGFFAEEITNEKIYLNATAHFDSRFESSIDYLRALNPGVEIWITEWAVAFWGETLPYRDSFNTSHFAAIYFANALTAILANPAITVAGYHNLPFLFERTGAGEAGAAPVSIYYMAKLLSELFVEEGAEVFSLRFDGDPVHRSSHKDFPGKMASSQGVLVLANDVRKLLIINKTKGQKDYDLSNFCTESARCDASLISYSGDVQTGPDYSMSERSIINDNLVLSGYSAALVRLQASEDNAVLE